MELREKRVYIALSIIALLLFSLMSYIKGGAFDFDETFSLAMIEHSFGEMWKITARDYHPPLSYFILKILSWIIKPFSEGNLEIYRVTSILGYFGTILLCVFPIRRLFGFKVSVVAILLFIFTPVSFYIYSNFRMYAWATPFVLASFVYACDVFRSQSKWAWLKLTLFAFAAMYTHYYALISSFVIYILLLVFILSNKEKRTLLRGYVVSGAVLLLLYAPWLCFFASQLAEVKNDYWIENPALSDVVFAIQYYFVPKYYTEKYINLLSNSWLLAVIPIVLLFAVVVVSLPYLRFKSCGFNKNQQLYVAFIAFFVLIIAMVLVMVYTFAVSPVYHIRYLMCYFGLFVLGISICISHLIEEKQLFGKLAVFCFSVFLLFDFGLCVYFNIVRCRFNISNEANAQTITAVENYYCDEESFSDMAYLTVLHPQNNYYLITDDNPTTRKITPPYIENDTVSGMPFYNFAKIKKIKTSELFYYISKSNPQLDSVFNKEFQVIDSIYSGLYLVQPLIY